jgi:flagellar hook-associated protein FlgK
MTEMSGLQTALSALYAQRRGLEVTGENVANATTEGYSRQAVNLQEISGPAAPSLWSKYQGVGSGVQVTDVTRFRDQFLEIRAALEHGASGQLNQMSSALGNLETIFGEPSDNGIQAQMADFWSGFDDVANNPGDAAARTQLLQQGTTLATSFNTVAGQITQARTDTVSQLTAMVNDVNAQAANIAKLNDAIKNREAAGISANDLLDQRDLAANKLADEIGATITPGAFGQVNIAVGGTSLVTENRAETLSVDTSQPTVTVRWTKDNYPAAISSGQVGGMLQVINQTLPQYATGFNNIAVQLRNDVNSLQSAVGGQLTTATQNQSAAGNLTFQVALNGGAYQTVTVAGADWSGAGGAAALQTAMQTAINTAIGAGNETVTVTGGNGTPMNIAMAPTGTNKVLVQASAGNNGFTALLGNTAIGLDGVGGRQFFTGTDASTIAVSQDIATNPSGIAAGIAANGALDNSVALAAGGLGQSTTGADAQYRAFIVGLGTNSKATQQRASIQAATTSSIDDQRDSTSSVSTDEEMVNLVQFQRAYEASARVMTVVDSMLNTLINGTGVTR